MANKAVEQRVADHLKDAEAYSMQLDREAKVHTNVDNPQYSNRLLAADQGHALRMVVYHGLAAIAEAIRSRS